MAALRSLKTDPAPARPFRRRRLTFAFLAVFTGELVGLAVIGYLVAHAV